MGHVGWLRTISASPGLNFILHRLLPHTYCRTIMSCWRDEDGSTLLHVALTEALVAQPGGDELGALLKTVRALLYAGVSLHAVNKLNQTATKQARLALQQLRANDVRQAAHRATFLAAFEQVLGMLERLQAVGHNLQLRIKGSNGQATAVVSVHSISSTMVWLAPRALQLILCHPTGPAHVCMRRLL